MFRPIWSRWKEWRLTQPVHVHHSILRAGNLTLQCVWNTRTIVISTSNCHLELLQYLSLYHACFLFICMYLWPYYWINKVCHIFLLFVSNRSSHNQMTEYFEEHSDDKQFWCKDNYVAGHFFKVYLTENSVEHRFSWFCSFRRLCECGV